MRTAHPRVPKGSFAWKEEYEVGVKEIDEQHEGLFDVLNELTRSFGPRKGHETLATVMRVLSEYVARHFETEEKYMRHYGYPGFDAHRIAHSEFARDIERFTVRVNAGDHTVGFKLVHYLRVWVSQHVLIEDQKMRPFFADRSKG